MKYDFSQFERMGSCDMDLTVTALVHGRQAFLACNHCLPNAVLYPVGNHPAATIQHHLLRDHGIVLAFVECPELPPNAWRLIRIGEHETVPIGSNGA